MWGGRSLHPGTRWQEAEEADGWIKDCALQDWPGKGSAGACVCFGPLFCTEENSVSILTHWAPFSGHGLKESVDGSGKGSRGRGRRHCLLTFHVMCLSTHHPQCSIQILCFFQLTRSWVEQLCLGWAVVWPVLQSSFQVRRCLARPDLGAACGSSDSSTSPRGQKRAEHSLQRDPPVG